MLTNQGGLFQAKGIAADYDSLKHLQSLQGASEIAIEKSGSGGGR